MSHNVKVKAQFKSLDALKKAFEALGWKIVENSTVRGWRGEERNNVFPLVAKNPTEAMFSVVDFVIEKGNGEYVVRANTDSDYIRRTASSLGNSNLNKLMQRSTIEIAKAKAKLLGHDFEIVENENHTYKLVANY